ncbi:MAG TPA: hypothetical protein V6D19_20995 [Stenomitos sp.]
MNLKKLTLPVFFVMIVFIGFGDRFLPSPLNQMSYSARTSVNRFLMGLAPSFRAERPDGNTEKAVNSLNP